MKVIFVCGGTAGHINPALAVAARLKDMVPDVKLLFVGSGREMENKLIPEAGYKLVNIKMSGLSRGFSPSKIISNIKTAGKLMSAKKEAGKLLSSFKPDAVAGTGGYICYPVLLKASGMGIPTLIHESNAVPGLTTRLLSTRADKVLVSFPGLEKMYRQPERVVFTGTPVRKGFDIQKDSGKRNSHNEKPLVVSFWGSLGAEHMNEVIAHMIKLNVDGMGFWHIHAAGKSGYAEKIKDRLTQLGITGDLPPNIEVRDYIDDMPSVMAAADIVLCRAGASTLAELTVMGKPAVLVPSPYVTDNHQQHNAMQLKKAGGAIVLPEEECTGSVLYETVMSLIKDIASLQSMSEAQKTQGTNDAAERMAKMILDMAQ